MWLDRNPIPEDYLLIVDLEIWLETDHPEQTLLPVLSGWFSLTCHLTFARC